MAYYRPTLRTIRLSHLIVDTFETSNNGIRQEVIKRHDENSILRKFGKSGEDIDERNNYNFTKHVKSFQEFQECHFGCLFAKADSVSTIVCVRAEFLCGSCSLTLAFRTCITTSECKYALSRHVGSPNVVVAARHAREAG